jgi:predicted nuclease of predicted toxin-antitoxin system
MTILVDHNVEGQATLLWGDLAKEGWLDLLPLRLVTMREVGLPLDSNDREVWRFAQSQQMILLTGNRQMRGANSLERTVREENTATSMPVITIGNVERFGERAYRQQCASRLIQVVINIDDYRGAGRIFIP